jgi:hypothetical protein
VEVSSSEDDVLNLDALVGKKKTSAGDDTEDGGVYSAEPIAPNLISSSAPERSDLSTTVQVATFFSSQWQVWAQASSARYWVEQATSSG